MRTAAESGELGTGTVTRAPIGTASNTLSVRLELLEQANGAVLWTNEISQSYSKTEGIYYNYAMDFGYPEMFRDGMKQAVSSLYQYVESKPASFWQAMIYHLKSAQ
jgi:hypothetical protein